MSMTNTVTSDTLLPTSDNGVWFFYDNVLLSTVFIVTFSDGEQVAVSGIDDREDNNLVWGLPQNDTVNMNLNGAQDGATITFYMYDGVSIGSVLYTYTHSAGYADPGIQMVYDPVHQTLDFNQSDDQGAIDSNTGEFHSINLTNVVDDTPINCFLHGTLILTSRGEQPVEALRAGDLVATRFGGLRPIQWIGTQAFSGRLAGAGHQPIRFAAGSLGEGLPHTDLRVSPGHAMLVNEQLAHAAALVNDATITREAVTGGIAYYHLDLGEHDCVLANGTWAETYFEDCNRDSFHNAGEFNARHPGREPIRQGTCLPILTEGHPDLPALRDRLAPAPLAPHLLADGRMLALVEIAPDTWQATIPEGTTRLRLRSPAFQPQGEARSLGLMVHALALDGTPLAAEGDGWHESEQHGRWTDGNAALPARPGTLLLRGWWPWTEPARRAA